MTRVQERTSVARDTGSRVSREVYKVAFGVLVATALVIGVVAFASLGVGLAKAVLMIIGA